ncbi:MAG TPA: hypothetical protein PK443_03815 [bacterium]|nr:hypothetical protein [bacterium]
MKTKLFIIFFVLLAFYGCKESGYRHEYNAYVLYNLMDGCIKTAPEQTDDKIKSCGCIADYVMIKTPYKKFMEWDTFIGMNKNSPDEYIKLVSEARIFCDK